MDTDIKILSWNINGLRTQKNNFKQFLDNLNAQIICFQETKITRDQLEEFLAIVDGYVSFFSFSRKRSGYSGVVTYCKKEVTPSFAQEGLSGVLNIGFLKNHGGSHETLSDGWDIKDLKDLDAEGRSIITQHPFTNEKGEKNLLTVINVYCPRADPEKPERASFKLTFYKLLRQRATAIKQSGSFVVIVGDLNTSHKQIDHCDPCEDEEFEACEDRKYLDSFLLKSYKEDNLNDDNKRCRSPENVSSSVRRSSDFTYSDSFKMVDTFRYFYPFKEKCFTCWNTRVNARLTNYGTRIDYVLCDEDFLPHLNDAFIHADIEGSDHCPVSLNLVKTEFKFHHSIPPICTKFYPEFHGNQQKLFSYFKPNSKVSGITPCFSDISNDSVKSKVSTTLKRKLEGASSKSKSKKGEVKQFSIESFLIKSQDSHGSSSTESESTPSSSQDLDLESDSNSQNLDVELDSTIQCLLENGVDTNESNEQINLKPENSDVNVNKVDRTCVKRNSGWGFMMRTPAPPPLCPGHKEPCVLKTVKKKGPNLNKQFYACARGVGKEGDPNCQCNFFKWFNGR